MVTYQQSGVSINAGNELVRRIQKMTASSRSASQIGGFSGLFPIPSASGKQFISGCCDGVGTKLKLAFLLDKHDTVGIDLVAMNVNDLICTGAKPLFFLDYFACGKLDVDTAEEVIRGIHQGCEESGCVLLGGETAEMPGFYKDGEYDLAGFAVGLVEGKKIFDKKKVRHGDIVIGLPSSGFHSNGYSLVRKVFNDRELKKYGHELITPTRLYVKDVLALLAKPNHGVKGIAHITGGGWYENIPRVFPEGLGADLKKGTWPVLNIFERVRAKGKISETEMFRTFNMGIGMVMVADPKSVQKIMNHFRKAYVLGRVTSAHAGVKFIS